MKLSFDTVKSITVGAARIWEENGIINFRKCTQKQIDAWNAFDPVLARNATATTGVRLDFHTDSKNFAFTVASGTKYEIYINDIFVRQVLTGDLNDGRFDFALNCEACKEGENRITLVLPSHDDPAALSSVELDDGATATPHKFDCKILFIGDSITQGWDSGYDSLSYAYRVSRFFNAESMIYGVGGGFFHESVLDDSIDFDPDFIIVAYGTNDWGRCSSIEQLRSNADGFLKALTKKYPDKPIFGLSPIWRGATEGVVRGTGTFSEVCEAVKEKIVSNGLILIDGKTLTPHLHEFFADQNLHPNALGFGIYAENLIKAIQKHLNK